MPMLSAAIRSRPVVVFGVRCWSGRHGHATRRLADCAVHVAALRSSQTIGYRPGLARSIAGPERLRSPGSVGAAVAISAAVSMSAATEPVHREDRRHCHDPDPVA